MAKLPRTRATGKLSVVIDRRAPPRHRLHASEIDLSRARTNAKLKILERTSLGKLSMPERGGREQGHRVVI